MNGLERFQRGKLTVCGTEMDGKQASLAQIRNHTGMVFQHFNLFPHLSVLDNLTMGPIYARGKPEMKAVERARELLDRVRLADQVAKFPGQISGDSASAWPLPAR